ncbi:hypothetical protein TruAng_009905 [Truncatella angustata]|nr:hypothetical protein TruAng_009905 [Truncatella angustata]
MRTGTLLPIIRGRQVGAKRLQSYLDKIWQTSEQSSCCSWKYISTPLSGRLISPEVSRLFEGGISAVVHFAQSRLQSDFFGFKYMDMEYDWASDPSLGFHLYLRHSVDMFTRDGNFTDGFRLLDRAFGMYSDVLVVCPPTVIWTTMLSGLLLAQARQDLADCFIRYAAALSTIKLGPAHPLSRLWFMIKSLSAEENRQAAVTILRAYLDAIASDVAAGETFRKVSAIHHVRWLLRVGAVTLESARKIFDIAVEAIRKDTTKLRVDWYFWTKCFWFEILYDCGMYAEAFNASTEAGMLIHSGHPDFALSHCVYPGKQLPKSSSFSPAYTQGAY